MGLYIFMEICFSFFECFVIKFLYNVYLEVRFSFFYNVNWWCIIWNVKGCKVIVIMKISIILIYIGEKGK